MRTVEKMTMLALGFCFTSVTGCSSQVDGTNPSVANEETTGSVNLALQLGDGRTINSASFTITGPNGFTRSGSIDVSHSATLSALIGGIPAAMGFQITLTATTSDASATCGGSANFDVLAGKVAAV